MLYRVTRRKLESLVFQSRRRTLTKRLMKVDIPVPIAIDQREVAFCHFAQMALVNPKKKKKLGYPHLKAQKKINNFLAWFGMSGNKSSDIVMSGCESTEFSASTRFSASSTGGVCALKKSTTPNLELGVSKENVSKTNELMKILEITGDLEMCTSLPPENCRPTTKMMCHEYFVDDNESEMTDIEQVLEITEDFEMCTSLPPENCRPMPKMMCHEYFVDDNESEMTDIEQVLEIAGDFEMCATLPSKNVRQTTKMMCHEYFVDDNESEMTDIKQVNAINLIVDMLKGLSLAHKRKIKESKKEHFEAFQTHRPCAQRWSPYAKKVSKCNLKMCH